MEIINGIRYTNPKMHLIRAADNTTMFALCGRKIQLPLNIQYSYGRGLCKSCMKLAPDQNAPDVEEIVRVLSEALNNESVDRSGSSETLTSK